jgi:ammonia channel protein AmtB
VTDMSMWMATVAVAVVVALVLIWLGYQLALDRMRDTRAFIAQQKAALDAQWWQLDQTRRIRSVFWAARQAMHAEAEDNLWPPAADNKNTNRDENQEGAR